MPKTRLDAFIRAAREMGDSEEYIQRRMTKVKLVVAFLKASLDEEVRDEDFERVVEETKASLALGRLAYLVAPEETMKVVNDAIAKHNAKS